MSHPLERLRDEALREIESATDDQALETTRVVSGRSGSISSWGEQMKRSRRKKPVVGKLLNEVRNAVTAAIETRNAQFRLQKNPARSRRSTSPSRNAARDRFSASASPNARACNSNFRRMGFALAEGPDIETVSMFRCSEYATRPPRPQ
jgi:phenylalanyl-tRNA synthetase alpha chain